jgi:DNA polymerase-3 subunit delta
MRGFEWLRESLSHPVKPVYVIHGDDQYLRRESAGGIVSAVLGNQADDMGVRRFEGSTASLADVLDELQTVPFFSKRRLVLVDDADTFVTRNRKELESSLGQISRTGVLVLLVKTWPANTRLAKLVEEVGLSLDCKSPAERELLPWLIQLAAKLNCRIEQDAARLLLELVGPEVGLLASEVEKLAVYVGAAGHIRSVDVTTMVEAGRLETVWKVLDAATTGHAAAAVADLDGLLASGEYPVKVLAAFTSSLLKVHHAGRLRAARLPLEEACRTAGIRDFAFEKTRLQHAHLGPARVDQIPAMLLKADLDLKGNSPLDPRVILEQFLIQLALPRTD